MHNYVVKNVIIFIIPLIAAMVGLVIASYRAPDDGVLSEKIAIFQRLNDEFDKDISEIIVDQFAIVNIIARTSYPDVAIDYSMGQQFYDVAYEIKDDDSIDLLLFDARHRTIHGGSQLIHADDEISAIGATLFENDRRIWFTTNYVIFMRHIIRDDTTVGYLAGIRRKENVIKAVIAEYSRRTSSELAILNPIVSVNYPSFVDGRIKLHYSYTHLKEQPINIKHAAIVGTVAVCVMVVLSLLFRRSLSKPFAEMEQIIEYISAGHSEAYSGNIPKDTQFARIAASLLQMHENRRKLEALRYQHEVQKRMGLVAAHIAHDMRSPLSVLKGYLRADMSPQDSDYAEYSVAASRSLTKLEVMADDLVDYAKASNLQRLPLSLKGLVCGGVLAETKDVAKEQGCAVSCDVPADLTANIDSHKMERVLINLVRNAAQAAHSRGSEIVLRSSAEGGNHLIITVSDNGRGIDAEAISHVFDSFFTKGKKGGTGLGLAYCKQVVEAHGGTIDVESEIGKGSTFTIRIPDCVVAANEVRTASTASSRIETASSDARIARLGRVLIADDDPDIRSRWRTIITERGGRIAADCHSADQLIADDSIDYAAIDTAIVDYDFKGDANTGVDLVRHLKRKGVKAVYMCTGFYGDAEIRRRAHAAGAEKILRKPIDVDELD